MFIGAETRLTVGFGHAQAKLADLIRGGLLGRASGGVYDQWRTALARDGPWRDRAVGDRARDVQAGPGAVPRHGGPTGPGHLAASVGSDRAARRAGPGPGRRHQAHPGRADASLLAVSAVCRPPLGGLAASLDQAIVRQCATAMIQAFTHHIAAAVTHPAASRGARHDGIAPEAWPEPETP